MFLKPFRIKSNSQVKNSERKALKSRLLKNFSTLTEDVLDTVFPNKEIVSMSKIITHANNVVTVFTVKKRPVIFEYNDKIYPTVFFLWQFPGLLKYFTTHPPVVSKLITGADLMLPGVVMPDFIAKNPNPGMFGKFEKGHIFAINITSNKAAIAVGITAHSAMDMYMCGGRGKCINIIHTISDYLCQMDSGNNSEMNIPDFGPPDWLLEQNPSEASHDTCIEAQQCENNETTSATSTIDKLAEDLNQQVALSDHTSLDHQVALGDNTNLDQQVALGDNCDSTEEMDKLLTYCFLKTLKYSGKKLTLPILTSNFYRLHIINACPNGKSLDIKKTSYKKLNKFLNKMKNEGVLNVAEQTKGVEIVTAIHFDHPLVTSFIRDEDDVTSAYSNSSDSNNKGGCVAVVESYNVTALVLPIFSEAGLRKGDNISSSDVRKHVKEYVKKHNLQSVVNSGVVVPNAELATILKTQNPVRWEDVMEIIFKSMSSAFKINHGGGQVSGKGKVQPVILSVCTRSGNKKVTIVDNLELFGIRAADFGKECQHGVAASTSVSKPPGKKYDQLLIQGNQVAFVGNLLMGKYNIPKKFIRGLELAVKNKK